MGVVRRRCTGHLLGELQPSIGGGEKKNFAYFCANLTASLQCDMPAFAKEIGGFDSIQTRAIAESLPIHAICAVEHNFMRVRPAALPL